MLLRCKQGFSVLELIATLIIASGILGVAIAGAQTRMTKGNLNKIVKEMLAFADASINYHEASGGCPVNITDLSPKYMGATPTKNVYGQGYSLSCLNGMITVSSGIPAGIAKDVFWGPLLEIVSTGAAFDTIKITKRTSTGASGRLLYDKKHLYGE